MAHPNRLQNARVLIFGGTSGIGLGVASLALANKATVIISGSTPAKVSSKVEHLKSLYPDSPSNSILGYACDLSNNNNIEANIKSTLDKATENGTKKLNHIVVTAGDPVQMPGLKDVNVDIALAGFHMRFLTNLMLGKLLASSPGHYLPVSPSSSLTLTSGANSEKPAPGWSLGAAWGSALEGLSRGMAVDLQPVRVNVVSPGLINTPLLARFKATLGEEGEKKVMEKTLVKKLGEVEDIAESYGALMKNWYATGVRSVSSGGSFYV